MIAFNPRNAVAYGLPQGFSSTVALAANTPQTILAAATNLQGAWVLSTYYYSNSAAFHRVAIVASPGAVTSIQGQQVLYGAAPLAGADLYTFFNTNVPVFVPQGSGIFRISDVGETAVIFQIQFSVIGINMGNI